MSALEKVLAEVSKAEEDLAKKKEEASKVERLAELFPDLEVVNGRWNRTVYSSAQVNARATHVFMRFNCGCCSDSPLEAWPYLETPYGHVYASPAFFFVGEKNWIAGAKPLEGWRSQLQAKKIPEAVLDRIQARFDADRQERIELAEDP